MFMKDIKKALKILRIVDDGKNAHIISDVERKIAFVELCQNKKALKKLLINKAFESIIAQNNLNNPKLKPNEKKFLNKI